MVGFFFNDDAPQIAQEQWRADLFARLRGQHRGVHNFSIGLLEGYFKLGSLEVEKITYDAGILTLSGLPGSSRQKFFVFTDAEDIVERARSLQRIGVVYSLPKLALAKQSAFRETAYELEHVFDPACYPNAKKRHQRITYPFKRLEAQAIAIRQARADDLLMIEDLHRDWVARKLADPATMQIMFPKARYINCVRIALAAPESYRCYVAYDAAGALIAVRVLYLEDAYAFDLAFFSRFWAAYSNMTEDVALAVMDDLRDPTRGITHLNCGASLNKNLSMFKAHYPCYQPISYAYGKV